LDRRIEKDGQIKPKAPKEPVSSAGESTDEKKEISATSASEDSAKDAEPTGDKEEQTKAESKPEDKKVEEDHVLAKRLARIAAEEAKLGTTREQLDQYQQQLTKARESIEGYRGTIEQFHNFQKSFANDPIEGFHVLGLTDKHVEALYWHLNDRIIKSGGLQRQQQFGPDQAREIARQEWEQAQQQQAQHGQQQMAAALTAARQVYAERVDGAFKANLAKFPAIKAAGISVDRIHEHVNNTYAQTGKAPSPEETLAHFEGLYQKEFEAAGYKRQVDAPAKKTGTTVTQEWSTGSGPVNGSNGKSQTLKESRDEIRRKLDAGFYKRNRTD
jgi:hypothetical protein